MMSAMDAAFSLVERAIERLCDVEAPAIADLAHALRVDIHTLDRAFRRCAGLSPVQFRQVVMVNGARWHLRHGPVLESALALGTSPGRLHDQCVRLEAMSPGEFRRCGEGVAIRHGEADSPLGPVQVAWTLRGLHRITYGDEMLRDLERDLPKAVLVRDDAEAAVWSERIFARSRTDVQVCVVGTPFQVAVWRALLTIPEGATTTYAALAAAIGRPTACRAVGQAVGANPVGVLIPCHRVIQASGALGGFAWGSTRKACLLAREVGTSAQHQ